MSDLFNLTKETWRGYYSAINNLPESFTSSSCSIRPRFTRFFRKDFFFFLLKLRLVTGRANRPPNRYTKPKMRLENNGIIERNNQDNKVDVSILHTNKSWYTAIKLH